MQIYHDTLNSVIRDSGTGNLVIAADDFRVQVSDQTANMITANTGAEVTLTYNGGTKIATTNTGISVTGNVVPTGNVHIQDAGQLQLGTGINGKIYHDGNNFIANNLTGDLYIDQAAVTQSIFFRVSDANALDTTALIISRNGDLTTGRDVTIAGDLTVNGTTTTVNSQTLAVVDPLIQLAKDNTANSLDIGLYGDYNDGTDRFLGLFSDASDGNKFKLFKGTTVEPTTTVNIGGAGYVAADLELANLVATEDIEIRSGNKLILQRPNNAVATEISTDVNGTMILNSVNDEGFKLQNAGTTILEIGNVSATGAVFAGTVTTPSQFIADNATLGSLSLRISGTETGRLDNFNSALRLINFHSTSDTVITGNGDILLTSIGSSNIKLSTSNIERLTIDSSGKSTFAGNVSIVTGGYPLIDLGISGTNYFRFIHDNPNDILKIGKNGAVTASSLVLNAIGDLGIGTVPSANLHVGNVGAAAEFWLQRTDGYNAVKFYGSTLADGQGFKINVNGGDRFAIDSSGNVGIGTDSPDTNLEVSSATGGVLRLTSTDTTVQTGESIGKIEFKSNDASTGGDNVMGFVSCVATNVGTRYALSFGTGDAAAAEERMRIDNSGTTTITNGTNDNTLLLLNGARGRRLRVQEHNTGNGGIEITSQDTSETGTTNANNRTILLNRSGGNIGVGTYPNANSTLHIANPNADTTRFTISAESNTANFSYIKSVDHTSNTNKMIFGNTYGYNTETDIMTLFNGMAGIGTNSPDRPLSVVGGNSMVARFQSQSANSFIQFSNTVSTADQVRIGSSSNDLVFSTNYTERMRIDSAGNVGIGTDSPSEKLEISSEVANGGSQLSIVNTSQDATAAPTKRAEIIYRTTDTVGTIKDSAYVRVTPDNNNNTSGSTYAIWTRKGNVNPTASMTIDNNGDVGIGVIAPYTGGTAGRRVLDVGGTSQALLAFSVGGAAKSYFFQDGTDFTMTNLASAGGNMIFENNGSERMRITGGGNVLIGTAVKETQGITLYGTGANGFYIKTTGTCGYMVTNSGGGGTDTSGVFTTYYNDTAIAGSITLSTANSISYNTSSDYRLKEDLQDFAGLDMVSKIPVYDFKWKTDESRSYGVMAHELQEVLPQAVSGDKDAEEMQSVDYSKIVPLLVKSIQEQQVMLKELKAEVDKLKQECKCKN